MYRYAAFGLLVGSNLPIPGLEPVPAAPPRPPNVTVTLGRLPDGCADGPAASERDVYEGEPDADGLPALRLTESDSHRVFRYGDGTTFVVAARGDAVWATWPTPLTVEDAATYLLGPVMSYVLHLRGRFSLHAGAFNLDDEAVAIAGAPEAGKSTLLAALALRGHRVLSDDVAPLLDADAGFRVEPSYPRVRLWEDSVDQLFGSREALPRLTPNWEKRYLDVAARGCFEERPLPLRALVVLDERSGEDRAPWIAPLRGRDALVAALGQLHSVWMTPRSPQRETFELACRLVRFVPVLRLVPHVDPAHLDRTCDRVVAAVRGLARRA